MQASSREVEHHLTHATYGIELAHCRRSHDRQHRRFALTCSWVVSQLYKLIVPGRPGLLDASSVNLWTRQ